MPDEWNKGNVLLSFSHRLPCDLSTMNRLVQQGYTVELMQEAGLVGNFRGKNPFTPHSVLRNRVE
jgi:hypothetical protein